MSIEKQHGDMTLLCDDCDTELGHMFDAQDELRAMIAYTKIEGWKVSKKGDSWVHLCPACIPEPKDKRQMELF